MRQDRNGSSGDGVILPQPVPLLLLLFFFQSREHVRASPVQKKNGLQERKEGKKVR